MRNCIRLFVIMGGIVIVGCGEKFEPAADPTSAVETSRIDSASSLSPLVGYAANPGMAVTASGDAVLANYFCFTTFAKPCDDASKARLAQWGFSDGDSVADLAFAATMATARPPGGETAKAVTDDEFVVAAYKAVLGRDPDEIGKKNNLAFLSEKNDRSQMLLGLIQSEEFRARPY